MVTAAAGIQRPRVSSLVPYHSSDGAAAVELAARCGLILDPWQEFVIEQGLGRRKDGKWAVFENGLVVPRQNGKSELLIARIIAGLWLFREELIIYSAHQFDTAMEIFNRLVSIVEDSDELRDAVRLNRSRVAIYSHGQEGITLKDGRRVRFKARSSGAGRGFSCDCLLLDEAMILKEQTHGDMLPTLSARPNPQVWYSGSAVDEEVHPHGIVFARIRERGIQGNDPSLNYFEWSVPGELADISDAVATDSYAWAQANPGLGIRITEEHTAREQRSMDPRTFAVERLGVGVWPSTEGDVARIDLDSWRAGIDLDSKPLDPVEFVFDVTPMRTAAAIAVCGKRADGLFHLEIVDHWPGTGWVPGRLAELVHKHRNSGVRCDTGGPAAALLAPIANLEVKVTPVNANEYAQACGLMADCVEQGLVRHLGTQELEQAIRGAGTRPLGDAWAWSRKASTADISPLVACSIALWGVQQHSPAPFFSFA